MNLERNRADVPNAAMDKCAMTGNGEHPASGQSGRTTDSAVSAADLLNQQIWCWGQDIKSPGGNLLVRYGFQRIEKPPGSDAASIYRLDISNTARIILRGFGVFFGDDRCGGLFLRRYAFAPQLTPTADLPRHAWMADDLPPLAVPGEDDLVRVQGLLFELVDWIRQYEVWIADTVGLAHRRQTLIAWNANRETVVPAEEVARAWRMLGLEVASHPDRFFACLADRSERHA